MARYRAKHLLAMDLDMLEPEAIESTNYKFEVGCIWTLAKIYMIVLHDWPVEHIENWIRLGWMEAVCNLTQHI